MEPEFQAEVEALNAALVESGLPPFPPMVASLTCMFCGDQISDRRFAVAEFGFRG
jgi:hypothetical protein